MRFVAMVAAMVAMFAVADPAQAGHCAAAVVVQHHHAAVQAVAVKPALVAVAVPAYGVSYGAAVITPHISTVTVAVPVAVPTYPVYPGDPGPAQRQAVRQEDRLADALDRIERRLAALEEKVK